MLGLETALGVVNTALDISVVRLVELLSWNPARIAGIQDRHGRPIAVGEVANISVWSSTDTWNVSRDEMASKSKNTPYHGMKIRGKVKYTVFNGELVVDNERAVR